MAKADSEWRVLCHGPIERREDNLRSVTGSLPGMSVKRVIVSHHRTIADEPAAVLRRVAASL